MEIHRNIIGYLDKKYTEKKRDLFALNRHGGLVVRESCEWELVGLIPGCNRPKSLKLVVVAFPIGF